uniref:BTB domain-containing protein n=1 Tax=Anopheles farauti TaxID=69004 RepID=A0A182Q2E0_9DIPT
MPSDTPPPSSATTVSHPSPASSHHDPNDANTRPDRDRSPGPSPDQPPPSAVGTAGHLLHPPHNTSSSSSSSSSSSTSSSASSSLSSLSLKRSLAPEEPATKPSPPCSPHTMEHHLQAHKASRATPGSPGAGRNQQQQQQQQQQPPSSSGSSTATGASAGGQQFCLRWNNYQTNLTSVFDQLLQSESFVDVTLACDGQSMKAHKMVLSACSPYFQTLFFDNPCQHPIVIMRDVSWAELKAIVEFMYKGEINVSQDQIGPLLKVAEMLKIRGLADVSGDGAGETAPGGRPDRDAAGSRGAEELERDEHKQLLNPLAIVHSSLLANGASSVGGSGSGGGTSGSSGSGNSTTTSSIAASAAAAKKQRSGRDRDTTKDQHRLDAARMSDFARDLSRDGHISSRDISSVAAAAAAAAAAAGLAAGEWPLGAAGLEAAAAAAVQASTPKSARKRRWPSGERSSIGSPADSTPDQLDVPSPIPPTPTSIAQTSSGSGGGGGGGASSNPLTSFPLPPALDSAAMAMSSLSSSIANHPDDMEIKPGIAEMIREEERSRTVVCDALAKEDSGF